MQQWLFLPVQKESSPSPATSTSSSSASSSASPSITTSSSEISTLLHSTSTASTCLLTLLLILDQIDHFVWNAQIFYLLGNQPSSSIIQFVELIHIVPSDVNFRQAEELVPLGACLNHLAQSKIHPCIAADEMAVESFAILQFNKHRLALRGIEEA